MDVGAWLRSIGLGQYEDNFRDNKIDADVLPQLTADDLKDIGVAAVGDRRRLEDPATLLLRLSRIHRVLLAAGAVTIFGAVAGAHEGVFG